MRAGATVPRRPEHEALCTAILELAKATAARLLTRDHLEGYVTLPARDRVGVERRAGDLERALVAFGAAWTAAEARAPGGALGRIAALLGTAEEATLLVLTAARELDRGLARTVAALGAGPLTCGLLLDLAAPTPDARLALVNLLHASAPLRRAGLITIDDAVARAGSVVSIAPAVVAVLRGEPVPPPPGVHVIEGGDRAAAIASLQGAGVPRARGGRVLALTGDGARAQDVAARLAAAAGGPLWVFSPIDGGAATLTDAWLAGALAGVDLRGARIDQAAAVARHAALLRTRVVALADADAAARVGLQVHAV